MAFRWWADDGPTLNAGFVIFQWIRPSIAKKPYIFVFFRGVQTACPPSGSTHDILAVFNVLSSLAFILRELIGSLCYCCLLAVSIICLFLCVPQDSLWYVIVAFSGHTYLLFIPLSMPYYVTFSNVPIC